MLRKTIIFFVLYFFLAIPSFSQGIRDSVFKIQAVDITAGRIFKKEEAGMKKTRVDSLVLLEKINLSLSDVLAENTTVYIKDYGRGALATASFRGTAPTHTRVSWNGIEINSPMLGMVDFSLIPVYIGDEMILSHGAASIGEQSGGLGGHISINNNVNWNNNISGRLYQSIGSYSTFNEFGQFNMGNKKIQSKTRLYHNFSKNDYKFRNEKILERDPTSGETFHPLQRNKNAEYTKHGALQEIYYRPVNNLVTSVKFWYQDASRGIPSVQSYEGNDTVYRSNNQYDKTIKGVSNTNWYFNKGKLELISGIDQQQLDYISTIQNAGSGKQKPVNSASNMFSWYNKAKTKYDLSKNISVAVASEANYFNITTLDSTVGSGYGERRMEYGIFLGTYFSFLEKMNISTELRKEFIPHSRSPLIYNLGMSYKPFNNQNLVVKSSIARNYHHPTLNDLYWQPGGNPDLAPEEGHTVEGGLHLIKDFGRVHVESQLTGYYSNINDWILWLPSIKGYWEAMNLRNVRSEGIEYDIKLTWERDQARFNLQANYAYTRSVNNGGPIGNNDKSMGSQLPFIPLHSGNIMGGITYKQFHIKFLYNHYGIRYLLSSNLVAPDNGFPFYRLYAQHLSHLSLGKKLRFNNFDAGMELKIHNLFDEEYRNVLNQLMPRQNYTLLFTLDF
jgi:iron complex outermembrane receptor protein